METVVSSTSVSSVLIIMHTGHGDASTGSAVPRTRGASVLGGNPDDLLSFRHGGEPWENPPDSRRWLAGIGRSCMLEETALEFDSLSRSYSTLAGGNVSRASAKSGRDAETLLDVLWLKFDGEETMTKEIVACLPFTHKQRVNGAFSAAVSEGLICSRTVGTAKMWRPMEAEKRRI